MANFLSSANMGMPIPVSGVDPGPDYSFNINNSLTILDGHDHSAGKGVPVTPAGLNISSDLSFLNNNLTGARSVRFQPQASPLALVTDVGCMYESGVDLYYNDGSGNQIRITQSGGVAGSPGSIAGLASPASATYVALSETFVWQSDALTPANLDAGFIILRNNVASSNGLTLMPPAAMGSNFTITLPSLPGSTKIMTLDASGNIGAQVDVDNSTLEITSNVLEVKALGINTSQIADQAVAPAKMGALNNPGLSASCGNFTTNSTGAVDVTNLSVTITTSSSNRPIRIEFLPEPTHSAYIGTAASQGGPQSIFTIDRSGTAVSSTRLFMDIGVTATTMFAPPGTLNFTDTTTAPSTTYTYKLTVLSTISPGAQTSVNSVQMLVYEI